MSASLLARLIQHAFQGYRGALLPLALIGRFHECKNLNGFFGAYRRLAGLEELANFHAQRFIAATAAARRHALVAEHHGAIIGLAGTDAAKRADPAVFPGAGDMIGPLRMHAPYRHATGAHDR